MDVWLLVVIGVVLMFGFVVFFGAPYLPTLKPQIETALDLLDLKPGQTLIEVGSGDGRVLLAAAHRGLHAVGYELNPILVLFSLWHTRKVRKQVKVVWGNALTKQWSATDGVFVFGVDRIMPKLYKKIVQSIDKPVKVASFSFTIPEQKPVVTKKGINLYIIAPLTK
jgi:precorrin-6B methylase 2